MTTPEADSLAEQFVRFAIDAGVLRFGEFKTKVGRLSPYFFDAGRFDDGAKLMRLGEFYARRLIASHVEFDMLFGPAYKGITLAAATAVALARLGRTLPFAFDRKEAKTHGEGGSLIGAPLAGRVVIVDDVITDGGSKREAAALIRAHGAEPAGVLIALDREERASDDDPRSSVQRLEAESGLRVVAIARLRDLMRTLESDGAEALDAHAARVRGYRDRYGV